MASLPIDYILTLVYNKTIEQGQTKTEKDTGKGGREYRKGKQEHPQARNRIREIETANEPRCLKPPAAGALLKGKGVRAMKKAEIKKALAAYQEISGQIAQLEAQKAQLADKLKAHMEAQGLGEMDVDGTTARYQEITSSRFDTREFKEAHKKLYSMFCKAQTTRRFTVTA